MQVQPKRHGPISPCSRHHRASVIADCQQLQLSGSDADKADLSEPRSAHSPLRVQREKNVKKTQSTTRNTDCWVMREAKRFQMWLTDEEASEHLAPCTSWCHGCACRWTIFGVFSQWDLQLFQEGRAPRRGGLMKSDREMRGGGGLWIPSRRAASDPDQIQISSALVVSLPVNSN